MFPLEISGIFFHSIGPVDSGTKFRKILNTGHLILISLTWKLWNSIDSMLIFFIEKGSIFENLKTFIITSHFLKIEGHWPCTMKKQNLLPHVRSPQTVTHYEIIFKILTNGYLTRFGIPPTRKHCKRIKCHSFAGNVTENIAMQTTCPSTQSYNTDFLFFSTYVEQAWEWLWHVFALFICSSLTKKVLNILSWTAH
jgi:hypothetical protein